MRRATSTDAQGVTSQVPRTRPHNARDTLGARTLPGPRAGWTQQVCPMAHGSLPRTRRGAKLPEPQSDLRAPLHPRRSLGPPASLPRPLGGCSCPS